MAEVLLPPWALPVSPQHVKLLDDASQDFGSGFGRGSTQVQVWADPRWQIKRSYKGMRGTERAALRSALNEAQGKGKFVRATIHEPQRGSFNATELFANNTFVNGTTGWGTEGNVTLAASDQVIRNTRTKSDGTLGGLVGLSRTATLTQFLPYLVRFFTRQGRGSDGQTFYNNGSPPDGLTGQASGTPWIKSNYGAYGLLWGVRVPGATGSYNFGTYVTNATGVYGGDYYDVLWSSVSQCALVDGGQNVLLWSDDFTNAAWGKTRATVSLSGVRAPDGTLTADSLVEDTSTNTHYTAQNFTISSSAQDFCFTVAAVPATRNWLCMELIENTGGTGIVAYFNLSTGAVGTTGTGANWSNLRTDISSLGSGWYQCTIIARKTNAATSVGAYLLLASADNVQSYTGSTLGLQIWRATAAPSSTPVRLMQSASTAVAATTQSGNALYTKGWPVNTSGLLLADDWFEINGELKQLIAPVNSDGNGLAYMQFRPQLAGAPADNDPIIINSPMGRFRLMNSHEYDDDYGLYLTADVELTEVYA